MVFKNQKNLHTEEYSRDLCLTQRDFQLPSDQNHPCVSHMGLFRERGKQEVREEMRRIGLGRKCTARLLPQGLGQDREREEDR